MKIQILNFDKKFSEQVYELQLNQWGIWDNERPIEKVEKDEIVLIALCEDKFAGVIMGKLEGDVFHLLICCIKPEFQKLGIGTLLLKTLIKKAVKKFPFSKFMAEAISVYGKCNSRKLLENFGFNLVRIDEKYWGKLYPHVLCKECFKSPCECDSLVFELKNIKSK